MLERLKMFREMAFDISTPGSTLTVSTNVPGGMALRDTIPLNTAGLRGIVNIRLLAMTGQHFQCKVVGPATIYEAKVCLRLMGISANWVWSLLPVRRTPEGWSVGRLPIQPTPDAFSTGRLPIRPTPEQWSAGRLPIRPTQDWQTMEIPMLGYDKEWRWIQLPVDAIE